MNRCLRDKDVLITVKTEIAPDECNSNSTDSFDVNDFKSTKTSSLSQKYSVPIHKNKADLMAELHNINIMGDESDFETVEPLQSKPSPPTPLPSQRVTSNVIGSDANGSSHVANSMSSSLNVTNSPDSQANGDFASDKLERCLAWAQSQSQNLSMCVASILSDHDYLSQENFVGIIKGNEEQESLSQKQREATDLAKQQEIDSQKTIIYGGDKMNGDAVTHSTDNENGQFNELNAMVTQLKDGSPQEQKSLLDKINKFVAEMRSKIDEDGGDTSKMSPEDVVDKATRNETTPELSSNHSEPMEHYGGAKFSTQNSAEEAKTNDGDELMVLELKNELKKVEEMSDTIKTNTQSLSNRLITIETQPNDQRISATEQFRKGFAMFIEDVANELTQLAIKLNPKSKLNHKSNHKLPSRRESSRSSNYSSDTEASNSNGSHRKSRRLKRRRKLPKSKADVAMSTDISSDGDNLVAKNTSEPIVMIQDVDDLMNSGANSNSANESLSKENDLHGFDVTDEVEFGIKTELMLNTTNEKSLMESAEKSFVSDTADKNISIESVASEKSVNKVADGMNNSAIEEMDRSSTDLSDHFNDDDDDDDEDDEEIRKLCDISSIAAKRIAPTGGSGGKMNGMVDAKKPAKKAPKTDAVATFLQQNSDDVENSFIESEEEKSEREEFTEEQYLKEQNQMLKDQLLLSSSESDDDDDSDMDGLTNGKGSDFDDEKPTSESDESAVEKFLASETKGSKRKSESDIDDDEMDPKDKVSDKSKESKSDGESEKKVSPQKAKEQSSKKRDIERFDDGLDESDFDFDEDDDDDVGSISLSDAPRKAKSSITKNALRSIEKDDEILIASDDDDVLSGSESKKKSASKRTEADSSGNSAEVLDTSMFKTKKKSLNPQELSRALQSSRNKQTVSRVSPECISVSSDDDSEIESTTADKKDENDEDEEEKEKRVKRKLLRPDQLADDTKQAQKEEQERIKRLEKKNERLSQYIESQRQSQAAVEVDDGDDEMGTVKEVILDVDTKKKEKIAVHPEIVKHLKAHQIEGIKFMYDCCYGGVDNLDKYPGSGCILAHCMGLGKTLQLITLLHTVICSPRLKTDKVLVICPKSTVMNWKEEIERWLKDIKNTRRLKLFQFPDQSGIHGKLKTLKEWSECGKENKTAGCLLLGYEAFRMLVFHHTSKRSLEKYSENDLEKSRKAIHKYLLDPGADLVVCDEGHMIKNQKSTTSMAVNQIKTRRRIVLTGTPIQNNLKEYYSMVNFIKPSFLGTEKEFANLYVNPIKNGQHKDSSKSEIKYMKQRSYVLHKKLSRFVQRREAALLKSFLPEKFEYVLFIPMTDVQTNLYEYFLENRPNQDQKGKNLIPDYTVLRKIWTHPKVLENAYLNAIQNKMRVKSAIPTATAGAANDSDDDQPDDVFDSQTGQMSVTSDWWRTHLTKEDLETILPSNKLKILFEILEECRRNGEKCLIFSAFVAVLDVVEFFMRQIHAQREEGTKPGLETFQGPWILGKNYYRLDGKTAKSYRHDMITKFNKPENQTTRVFLISAKAGGQGINLIGANRVILLDTSWNPSNDQQNIFRVFRLGQKRVCYIYRLLSMGTMEEKVYSRSVTKQAMSCRVMDEQQIDRHYNMAELTELYILTKPNMAERQRPILPKDSLLANLLLKFPQMVYKYHEHDSLLENKGEEELSEQEKNDAWAAYEEDVKRKNETNLGAYNSNFGMLPNYPSALGSAAYASSLFNSYNNLSGVSGLNYPYNMYNSAYNPYSSDQSHWQFNNDYSTFYNNLMTMGRSTMNSYNPNSSNLLSPPNHSASVSSPPPSLMNLNNFSAAAASSSSAAASSAAASRNWMQSNASSSGYANSLLSSLAQSSSSAKNSYASYLNSIMYNALGTNNSAAAAAALQAAQAAVAASSSSSAANPNASKTPPLSVSDFNQLAYLQKQNLSNLTSGGASNPISSTTSLANSSSGQQHGPNALANPLLTKELTIPRNPMPGLKDLPHLNVPIPTSVITKTTTSSSSTLSSMLSTGSGANTTSKTSSKSPDPKITSSIDKATAKQTAKSGSTTAENQLIIKDVRTINNESRDSPDTTGNKQLHGQTKSDINKEKPSASNGVSSTVEMLKKSKAPAATPISMGNMGIVYPPQKPSQIASAVSKAAVPSSTIAVPPNHKSKDKELPRKPIATTSGLTISKASSNQPMPAIIRKPLQSKQTDLTNDAVAAINKNKALTVTARSVPAPVSKTPPIADVNNSITLSPIPNLASKFGSSGVSITPQLAQTKAQSRIQTNASPVPVAISKVNINQTTITKSPTPSAATKTNGLGTRQTNVLKVSTAMPKTSHTASPVSRSLTAKPNTSPKITVPKPSVLTTAPINYKPIVAQTKAQAQTQGKANSSGLQINRIVSKHTSPQQMANKLSAIGGLEVRKRSAEPMNAIASKRSKPIGSSTTTSSSNSGSQKAHSPLQGIRVGKTKPHTSNSQITPVEIVELE